jgi:hypothetical protein
MMTKIEGTDYFFSVKDSNPFELNEIIDKLENKYSANKFEDISSNNYQNNKEKFKTKSELEQSWKSKLDLEDSKIAGEIRKSDIYRLEDGSLLSTPLVDYFTK